MIFFDYLFYRISKMYISTHMDETDPELGGGAVTSLFQYFNLTTILYFLFSIKLTKYLAVGLALFIFIFNLIFFFKKKKLQKCKKKWDNEPKKNKWIKGVLIIIYMIISVFFWGLALSKMYGGSNVSD